MAARPSPSSPTSPAPGPGRSRRSCSPRRWPDHVRLQLLGLPHTSTTRDYEWCAFTSKTRRFATMMTARGYQVTLYAGPENEADCEEHVVCISRAEQDE